MQWQELYGQERQPGPEEIAAYVGSPLWGELVSFVEDTWRAKPAVEYSRCSMEPGWNVKYKKGGRSLCTLYPRQGGFACMIVIGSREAARAGLTLEACTPYVQALYGSAKPLNGGRWLLLEITSQEILEDAKRLLYLRAGPPKGRLTGG